MSTTIDHLSTDHVVHVVQSFVDARGIAHHVGEHGLIVKLAFNAGTGEITMQWERDGQQETMCFLLTARTGPGNGRMRQYFEVGEYMAPDREGMRLVPGIGYVPVAPPLPPVTDELIRTDARFDEAIERVWALAGRQRFAEAQEQLNAIVMAEGRRGDNNLRAAEPICAIARAHAFDDDLTVYAWLRERGMGLWYAWGAGASSGGDGTYRLTEIRAAEAGFARLDRARG